MSCGRPHETPCDEVLDHLYEFLDNELPDSDLGRIRQHLDECGPCLREYGLEETVKSLVKRSCHDAAPDALRSKVLLKIQQVRVEIQGADGSTALVQSTRLEGSGF
jgi:mycothiol system anti-sigma-R factor